MRLAMLASVSVAALMLSVTVADAGPARQQCYGFNIFGQQFDCGHDQAKGDPSRVERPEPPPPGDDDDTDPDDDDSGDDDDDDNGGCKDNKGPY